MKTNLESLCNDSVLGARHSGDSTNVVDAVIELGNERQRLLLKMKDAVRSRDLQSVFQYAEELCGENELRKKSQ